MSSRGWDELKRVFNPSGPKKSSSLKVVESWTEREERTRSRDSVSRVSLVFRRRPNYARPVSVPLRLGADNPDLTG